MLRAVTAPVANPEDGEVLLEVKDANGEVKECFVLRMKTNAICRLEQAMGMHVHKLGPRLSNPGMQDLRCLLFAALSDRHPLMTQAEVGNLIDRVGFDAATAAVMEAFTLGFPEAVKGEAAKTPEGKGNGRGTGRASSRTRLKRGSVQ
jgi:hypothetical protein